MSSWGHRVLSATQEQRDNRNLPQKWGRNGEYESLPTWCAVRGCSQPVVYVTSYDYVTGRKGRVSYASRFVCEGHGRKFAAKHKVEAPDPAIPAENVRTRGDENAAIFGAAVAALAEGK